MHKQIMLGNEAAARGAFEAGCQVAAAYPGTPSTEILEAVGRNHPQIKAQWSPNEKVALEVAFGAALGGVRSLAVMKHVGLNVAADPLFTFSYTGVNAGLVVITADDPGQWSSQNEQDNRHYARHAKVPMLEPSSPEETRCFIREAFQISEKFDCLVLVRITTRIAHSRALVNLEEELPTAPRSFVRNPPKNVMIPAHGRRRHVEVEKRLNDLRSFSDQSDLNVVESGGRQRGIITDSVAYQYVKEAAPDDSVLKIGMVWPLPEQKIRQFAAEVDELLVVEELDPFIENWVRAAGIPVTRGKDILPMCGELTPELVAEALGKKQDSHKPPVCPEKLPIRPPRLCKGCPHVPVFKALKNLDLNVIGDIGCYTLGALPPYNSMHTQTCMGASIGMHLGMEKADPESAGRSVAVIGDSTFVHSGITGLIDMVYNHGTGTVIILDNRTTAMTGHQEHPGTGVTLAGEPTRELNLAELCRAVGVDRVELFDPFAVDDLEKLIKTEVETREPSVLIARRPCILNKG